MPYVTYGKEVEYRKYQPEGTYINQGEAEVNKQPEG